LSVTAKSVVSYLRCAGYMEICCWFLFICFYCFEWTLACYFWRSLPVWEAKCQK